MSKDQVSTPNLVLVVYYVNRILTRTQRVALSSQQGKVLVRICIKRSVNWQVNKTKIYCISDAGELANTKSNSRSIIGSVLFVEGNIISFKSKTTTCITTDAAHSELIALYSATKIVKAVENLFVSLCPIVLEKPITLFGDNLASLWISRTKNNSTRTKHYNLKLHYIYKQITNDTLVTKYIPTADCLAE